MSISNSEDDLEAQLTRTLGGFISHEIRHVSVYEDKIVLYALGKAEDEKQLSLEIKAPWRIIEQEEVLVGSLDAQRAGHHRLRKTNVENRCRKLVGKKLASFELLDFCLHFEGGLSLEHFAAATSEDECFVTITDTALTHSAFRLGFGWIEPQISR